MSTWFGLRRSNKKPTACSHGTLVVKSQINIKSLVPFTSFHPQKSVFLL